MSGRESVTSDNQEGYSKLDQDEVGLSQDLTGGNNPDDCVPPHKVGNLLQKSMEIVGCLLENSSEGLRLPVTGILTVRN